VLAHPFSTTGNDCIVRQFCLRGVSIGRVVEHQHNEGYGASLIDGMAAGSNDIIVIIDADCEYPPEAIPDLLVALENNQVVYTSRFLNRNNASEANMPWLKMKGNQVISGMFNLIFNQQTSQPDSELNANWKKYIGISLSEFELFVATSL